jgi:hypothetical protein
MLRLRYAAFLSDRAPISDLSTHPQSGITNNRYMSNWLAFTIVGNPKRFISSSNLVPRACDPREGTRGSGIIQDPGNEVGTHIDNRVFPRWRRLEDVVYIYIYIYTN